MKTRNGFISNSSSTSFIVAWDKPVKGLPDVTNLVEHVPYAKRILRQMRKQKGIVICTPPKDNCDQCRDRFLCYSHRGKVQVIQALRQWYGYEEDDYDFGDEYSKLLLDFVEQNEGKVIYFLRFADGGEDGDALESEMRHCDYDILEAVPHKDIT